MGRPAKRIVGVRSRRRATRHCHAANPTVGDSYRQEYYKGHAEDVAEVVKVGETKKIDIGEYTAVVVTEDWNRSTRRPSRTSTSRPAWV